MMIETISTSAFASVAVAVEVNQETAVKQESTTAQEINVKESAPVLLLEAVDLCWVPFEEMPALTPAQ